MTWSAFINWLSSWFVSDDKKLKQILLNQAEARGLILQILAELQKINGGQGEAEALAKRISDKTGQLKAAADAASEVTNP